jgi:hypothetical protein
MTAVGIIGMANAVVLEMISKGYILLKEIIESDNIYYVNKLDGEAYSFRNPYIFACRNGRVQFQAHAIVRVVVSIFTLSHIFSLFIKVLFCLSN